MRKKEKRTLLYPSIPKAKEREIWGAICYDYLGVNCWIITKSRALRDLEHYATNPRGSIVELRDVVAIVVAVTSGLAATGRLGKRLCHGRENSDSRNYKLHANSLEFPLSLSLSLPSFLPLRQLPPCLPLFLSHTPLARCALGALHVLRGPGTRFAIPPS